MKDINIVEFLENEVYLNGNSIERLKSVKIEKNSQSLSEVTLVIDTIVQGKENCERGGKYHGGF